jgi:hypothetical protein
MLKARRGVLKNEGDGFRLDTYAKGNLMRIEDTVFR